MGEYVDVKNLPDTVQVALKAVGYGRSSIEVIASESLVLGMPGAGDGFRAFVCLVDLETGQHRTVTGSWGGANMFNPTNPVDTDTSEYSLPPQGVAIRGTRGGSQPVWARIHISTAMVSRILTAGPREELPQVEKDALYAHHGIKGGEYRRDYLRRHKVPSSAVDELVSRGLLKRNRAGATSITTEGRNALGSYHGF